MAVLNNTKCTLYYVRDCKSTLGDTRSIPLFLVSPSQLVQSQALGLMSDALIAVVTGHRSDQSYTSVIRPQDPAVYKFSQHMSVYPGEVCKRRMFY